MPTAEIVVESLMGLWRTVWGKRSKDQKSLLDNFSLEYNWCLTVASGVMILCDINLLLRYEGPCASQLPETKI